MKPLTENQKTLLPQVRDKNKSKNTKKSLVIVALIDDYLAGKTQTRDELNAIKLAVQLYQVELKNENLRRKERQIQNKERTKANKELTREKIILGACSVHMSTKVQGTPFLDFLRSWSMGFLSDRDLDFMRTRYNLRNGNFSDTGEPYWSVLVGSYRYYVYKSKNKSDSGREYLYQIYEKKDSWTKIYRAWIL